MSERNRDDTPNFRRPKSQMDDDDRATIGAVARRRERERARSYPAGVPTPVTHSDYHRDLEPGELEPIEHEPSNGIPGYEDLPNDAELSKPTDIIMADPVATLIWQHVDNVAKRGVQRSRSITNSVMKMHRELVVSPENAKNLQQQIDQLQTDTLGNSRKIKMFTAALIAVGSAAMGSLLTVARGLYERGEREGAGEVRLEHVERDLQQMQQDLRSRQPDRPSWTLPPTSFKDTNK